MKAQTPAKGIMFNADYGSSKSYTIACECLDGDHQVHVWIELEGHDDTKEVEMSFYVNTRTPFWTEGFSRIKAAWDILVKGYREDHHSLVLKKQAALNVANTINRVVKELEGKK